MIRTDVDLNHAVGKRSIIVEIEPTIRMSIGQS